MLYPTASGTPPGQAFDVRGDITLKNLFITGYYELVDSNLNNLQGSLMNTGAAGANITIDSCVLSNTNGNHLRTDQAPKNVKITNTTFANMGFLGRSNLGAGKGIDVRAGSVDTLIIQNCTFVNWLDRVVRHYNSTAAIKYFKFDHNTLVNGGSFHGILSLGKVGYKSIITNNLLYDAFGFGNDTDATRQAEFTDSQEKDPFGKARMTWIMSAPNDTTVWTVSNNYYAVSDSQQGFYTRWASAGVTGEGSPLTWHINAKIGADSTNAFKKVSLRFSKIPKGMFNLMDWYRSPSGGNKTKNTPTTAWVRALHDFDRKGFQYVRDTLNGSFYASMNLSAASTDGKVIGDTRWSYLGSTGVGQDGAVPAVYSLEQNYPNPFNPSTVITYRIPVTGMVSLKVYNLIGQEVATLVNGVQTASSYEVPFDASKLSSGIYFYTLRSGDFVQTRKMMLLK
ncbi:MAG: T9SS type A sorting domain-containing protein [Bacteroidetes bacterium]|nr:MAG: T9SS type A sorting domain-containing protein [Bacteroidota bacterium]